MRRWLLFVLWLAGGDGGGATRTDEDGISKYWNEDIKALEHIYGKTSDKDLYGVTLPPNLIYNVATTKSKSTTEMKDPFIMSDLEQPNPTYPYNYVFQKQSTNIEKFKPSHSYISYHDNKPISQTTDSQTYKYLKHLEQSQKQNIDFSNNFSDFRPFSNYFDEETDEYRSIQDITDTSKANKVRDIEKEEIEDNRVYVNNKARSKVRQLKGNALNSRTKCRNGICRKKSSNYAHRARPTLKKIKRIIYNN